MSKQLAVIAAALCSASLAHASSTFIDFEAIPNGGTVSNEYAGVLFSGSSGPVEVSNYAQTWGTSAPQVACPLGDPRGYCSATLTVDFLTLVTSVGYLYTGDDDAGRWPSPAITVSAACCWTRTTCSAMPIRTRRTPIRSVLPAASHSS